MKYIYLLNSVLAISSLITVETDGDCNDFFVEITRQMCDFVTDFICC